MNKDSWLFSILAHPMYGYRQYIAKADHVVCVCVSKISSIYHIDSFGIPTSDFNLGMCAACRAVPCRAVSLSIHFQKIDIDMIHQHPMTIDLMVAASKLCTVLDQYPVSHQSIPLRLVSLNSIILSSDVHNF